jgi:hypothetical protein
MQYWHPSNLQNALELLHAGEYIERSGCRGQGYLAGGCSGLRSQGAKLSIRDAKIDDAERHSNEVVGAKLNA